MVCWEQADRFRWPAARRRKVLERAAREQAEEFEAARQRLLHAAQAGAAQSGDAQAGAGAGLHRAA